MSEDDGEDLDLFSVLPDEAANHRDCFHTDHWRRWETDVATPALRAAGYEPSNWHTTDGDSFGPLVRGVTLTKDGAAKNYYYG